MLSFQFHIQVYSHSLFPKFLLIYFYYLFGSIVLAAMIFCAVSSVSFSSVFYILICGMAGLFVSLLKKHETDRN